jgi:hypothetical protein
MVARRRPDLTLRKVRAAISNGSQLLAELDHRSAWARRWRDIQAAHIADLGGEDALTEAERILIRRAAMLCLQLELQEQRFARNEDGLAGTKQIETYQRVTNTLRRTLESLGLQRRARDVSPPTLEQYARQQQRLEAAE